MEGRTGRHDAARRPCHCGFRSPAFSQQLEWTRHGVAGARAGPQGLAAAQRDTLLRVPRGCGGLPRRPWLPLCGAPFPARSLLSWAGGRLPTRRCDRGPRAPAGSGGSDQAKAQALSPQTGRAGRRVCPQDDRGRGRVRRPCAPALAVRAGPGRAPWFLAGSPRALRASPCSGDTSRSQRGPHLRRGFLPPGPIRGPAGAARGGRGAQSTGNRVRREGGPRAAGRNGGARPRCGCGESQRQCASGFHRRWYETEKEGSRRRAHLSL